MSQTDEIERALRADIAGAVARGWCSPKNAAKVMDADLAEAITTELLPLFQQAVAGAYAAAANEAGRVQVLAPGSEPRTIRETILDIKKRILALTPADARQAQTERVCQAIADFCLLTAKRIGMELDAAKHETFGDAIQAAIASAEARARLEEANTLLERLTSAVEPSMFSAWCSAKNYIRARIIELEAAARTPDRTPKKKKPILSPSCEDCDTEAKCHGLGSGCAPDSTKEPE